MEPDQEFIVITNNYRAGGGGNFPGMNSSNIIIEAPDTNRGVLADYILELQTVNPEADGNWSFAPISSDVMVVFTSAPEAHETLEPGSPIEKIGVDSDGFGRYRIHLAE